jgi:hypothetical protein
MERDGRGKRNKVKKHQGLNRVDEFLQKGELVRSLVMNCSRLDWLLITKVVKQ